jgi:Asp-tRNA(Asn)/Glu-tRNA(Gln) amidotransferase A subunit family amidase
MIMPESANSPTWSELRGQLQKGTLTAEAAVRLSLERIAALESLNAFITVDAEGALKAARELDATRAATSTNEKPGALFGLSMAIKDLADVKGLPTTAASRVLHDAPAATSDAECVRRLRQAGAVIIGKTNLHEFAYGGSGAISAYGAVRNPRDIERVCDGSSSGSAAAVAAGMCFAALGTDTAGSIRLPAACCGVVGFKPTYGAVPVAGIIPLAWSYDHAGPLASTVEDAAAVFAVLSGQAEEWPPAQTLRCGVARDYFCDDLAPEVAEGFERTLNAARKLGWELREIELAHDEDRKASNAESWAFHAHWVAERSELYDPGTLPRIVNGRKVTVEQYVEARRALELFREAHRDGVAGVDVVLSPTSPILPPTLESFATPEARRQELVMLRNTRPFNVLGWPTVSLPTSAMTGLQVSARWGRDWLALSAARSLEQALGKKF